MQSPSVREAARRSPAALLIAVLLSAAVACGPGDPPVHEVVVDGGDATVVGLEPVTQQVRPGGVLRITNGNTDGTEGAVTHAFVVAPVDALPPVFVPQARGFGPNAGVWGHCRGGDAAAAVGTCPIPPVEGPQSWDGRAYWSTGALLPGESADVPIAEGAVGGSFICALHPELRVDIEVRGSADADVATPQAVPDADAFPGPPSALPTVLAGAREDGPPMGALNAFVPDHLEVDVGAEVTWIVEGRDPHDVNLGDLDDVDLLHARPDDARPLVPDGGWDGEGAVRSGYLSTDARGPAGATFTLRFDVPGTYRYVCRFHPSMEGVVEVVG